MQQRARVDPGRLQNLPAREGEQLARELRAAPGRARRRADQLLAVGVPRKRRQLFQHLQIALDDGQQVVEVVRDAAGQLADAFQALRVLERLFALRTLQARGQQIGERFEEAHLVVAENLRGTRADGQRADRAAAVLQRHRQHAGQPCIEVGTRYGEALLAAAVGDDDRPALRQHEAGWRVGAVGHACAAPLAVDEARCAGDTEFEPVAFEQVHDRHIDLQGLGGDRGHTVQQHMRVARIDRDAAELRQMFAVARALQCLLDARIGADVANRRNDEGQAVSLQRAERNLDHHLAAVLALGHELHLRAHRPRPRRRVP